MSRDYKDTVFLPKTDFSLQGVSDEAALRSDVTTRDYQDMRVGLNPHAKVFALHDGPPYANGNIHMGHALNKILKDFVVRSQYCLGRRIQFIPGWDCHGLPIEWQVEKNLMAEGKSKADLSVGEFRQLCRDYASGWVDTQREQFKSLGIAADWDNPYRTMDFQSEAQIVRSLHMLLMSGMLYTGTKPVLWSAVEETALAEAEVEHADLKVSSVYVRFWITGEECPDTSIVIWTTTPWTLPANRAIAFNPKIEYGVYRVTRVDDHKPTVLHHGERLVMAKALVEQTMAAINITGYEFVEDFDPEGVTCDHPLHGYDEEGYQFPVPLIPAKHVTDDTGTGFVHIAPEHGPEDYVCFTEAGLGEVPTTVGPDGAYLPHVPLLAGVKVLEKTPKGDYIFEFTNAKVAKLLEAMGNLLALNKVTISYPHSWRSKAPLFYRNTAQWFIKIDDALREATLDECSRVKFIPQSGGNRLEAGIQSRPDWLVSRQRVWGTPMAIIVHKETRAPILDDHINSMIASLFAAEGGDAWWEYDVAHFFRRSQYSSHLNPDDYEKVMDVLDVWFDSGCSHTLVDLPIESGQAIRADLYLEGSDQARGWFGSSALVGTALTDDAPFKAVLTHGFVLDKDGRKMSKSEGNVVDPLAEAPKYGTDVLRLWVALGDYTQDTRVGDQILTTTAEMYKRLRNTLRFLISNTQNMSVEELEFAARNRVPELEGYILTRTGDLMEQVVTSYEKYDFNGAVKAILEFCSNDLSAFYFDIRKDSLYCDRADSPKRMACRSALQVVLRNLLDVLKPILPFTAEEAYRMSDAREGSSTGAPCDVKKWATIRSAISVVNAELELARKDKLIGSGLGAKIIVTVPNEVLLHFDLGDEDLADIFRVSQAEVVGSDVSEVSVMVFKAEGQKCARSRKITLDVGSDPRYPDLSARDADAVAVWDALHGVA